MKKLYIILMLCFAFTAKAQKEDSTYCFSRTDILLLANKVQLIKDSLKHKTAIIKEQDSLIILYKDRNLIFKNQLENKQFEVDVLQKQTEILTESIKLLEPKWYDNKWLWFGNGVIVTIVTVLLVR